MVHYTTFTNLRVTGIFDADRAFDASALPVTATGSTASRALSDRFAERINVKNFGATGNGTTDDSTAVLAAFAAGRLLSFGAHVYFPTGKYNLASLTASTSCLRVFSGLTVSGDGYNNTTIVWNDDDGISLFRGPSSGRATDVILEDFAIQGTQDTRGNNIGTGAYPMLITACDILNIRRLRVEKSRIMGIAVRSSKNVTVQDCIVRLCGRDGINIAQSARYIITGNQVEHCDDDGIAAHTDTGGQETTPNGGVIANNTLFDSQGIKVLAARHCTISDNVLDCVKAQGITVHPEVHTGSATEGVAASLNIIIANNKITNVLDRAAIDALNTGNNYINIGGGSAQAGTLAAVPGSPDTGTATIIPYYDYINNNGAATTVPTAGGNGIIIANNIMSRTLKGGVAFSTYGRGLLLSRGGSTYDPTFTAAQVGQSIGISISRGHLNNVLISGNMFSGLTTGVSLGSFERIVGLTIRDNTFWDILSYGFLLNVTNGKPLRAYIENNVFDMDPLHSHPNRGANGTWAANGNPTAINFQSGDNGAIVRGNTFRNLCRDSSLDSSALSSSARFENNYIECDPVSVGGFSTSNKGVGIIRRTGGVSLIHTDSDPASATYGTILTPGGLTASSIPTTGTYMIGAFVRNSNPSVAAGKVLLGWARLTTGSAHVSGTDWSPLFATVT